MYTQVASRLFVAGSAQQVSRAVPMAGGNAVAIEVTVFSGTDLDVLIQESNDLQNWSSGPTLTNFTDVDVGSHYEGTDAVIAAQYVRLVYKAASDTVLAAGINVADL